MTNISENLKILLFCNNMTPTAFAKEVNLPQQTIQKIVAGHSKNPHKKTLEIIANYFDVTINELIGKLPKQPLEKIATPTKMVREIPLLSFPQIESWVKSQGTVEQYIQITINEIFIKENCFCAKMSDSSMSPYIQEGSLLIFDTFKGYVSRDFILVKLAKEKMPILRQVIVTEDVEFIKPLNPESGLTELQRLEKDDLFLAVLLETRYVFNSGGL